jgi:hypothetical protein
MTETVKIRRQMARTRAALTQKWAAVQRRYLGTQPSSDNGANTTMAKTKRKAGAKAAKARGKKTTSKKPSAKKAVAKRSSARGILSRAGRPAKPKPKKSRRARPGPAKAKKVLGEILTGAAMGAVTGAAVGAVTGAAQAVPPQGFGGNRQGGNEPAQPPQYQQ